MNKKPATEKAHQLREKIKALVERGVNGERAAAQAKLDRLERRYDFSAPRMSTADLFAGSFQKSSHAVFVCQLQPDTDISNAIKWAIEGSTQIQCSYRDGYNLFAEATTQTAKRLESIATTITLGITSLWMKFTAIPGASLDDRSAFIMGLSDGMTGQERDPGTLLPSRCRNVHAIKNKKKRALNHAPGISQHPYSIAVPLGKQIRFSVPISEVVCELDRTIKGALGN